jgi:hypothetical protein
MTLVPDPVEMLTSAEIENKFKMAQVLQIRNDYPRAISVFKSVCLAVERIARANPNSHVELHHIPLSLAKLSEIYVKREDQQKALAFLQCEKKFFEYIASNMPNRESENSTDGADGIDLPEHNLNTLFNEMHAAFDSPDAPPPRDPQEVVQMVLEAKKKYEEEQAAANLEKLKRIMAEREAKKDTSRWLQTLDYIDQHPIKVTFGAVGFMLLFLIITIGTFDRRTIPNRNLSNVGKNTGKGTSHSHEHPEQPRMNPKMTAEELQKLKETLEKLQKEKPSEL